MSNTPKCTQCGKHLETAEILEVTDMSDKNGTMLVDYYGKCSCGMSYTWTGHFKFACNTNVEQESD